MDNEIDQSNEALEDARTMRQKIAESVLGFEKKYPHLFVDSIQLKRVNSFPTMEQALVGVSTTIELKDLS